MELDADSTIPLFEQLENSLKDLIKSGSYQPGNRIPTEKELSQIYGVSRITIRRALDDLTKEGLLLKQQGKGTFVQNKKIMRKIQHTISFSHACKMNGMQPSSYVTKRELFQPHMINLQKEGIFGDDSVIFIQRLRLADNIPIMLENNYYSYTRFSFLLSEKLDGSLYELLNNKYHIKVGHPKNTYIDTLRAGVENAKLLKVSASEPLFLLYTEIYDTYDLLIHVGKQYIVGSKYRFNYD